MNNVKKDVLIDIQAKSTFVGEKLSIKSIY